MIGRIAAQNPARLSSLVPHEVQDATRSWFVRCCAGNGGVSQGKDAKAHHTATAHHRVYFVCQTRAPTATEYGFFGLGLHSRWRFDASVCSWYPGYTRWVPGAEYGVLMRCHPVRLFSLWKFPFNERRSEWVEILLTFSIGNALTGFWRGCLHTVTMYSVFMFAPWHNNNINHARRKIMRAILVVRLYKPSRP